MSESLSIAVSNCLFAGIPVWIISIALSKCKCVPRSCQSCQGTGKGNDSVFVSPYGSVDRYENICYRCNNRGHPLCWPCFIKEMAKSTAGLGVFLMIFGILFVRQ